MDDKRHYVNNVKKRLLKYLLETRETSVRTWDKLLNFVGGRLEMEQNAWYFIE